MAHGICVLEFESRFSSVGAAFLDIVRLIQLKESKYDQSRVSRLENIYSQ